jgi:hypothetical protein
MEDDQSVAHCINFVHNHMLEGKQLSVSHISQVQVGQIPNSVIVEYIPNEACNGDSCWNNLIQQYEHIRQKRIVDCQSPWQEPKIQKIYWVESFNNTHRRAIVQFENQQVATRLAKLTKFIVHNDRNTSSVF